MKNPKVRKIILLHIFLGFCLLIIYSACKKEKPTETNEFGILRQYLSIPENPFNYSHPDLPGYYDNSFIKIQDNTPIDNVTTDWGATLGRVLFYDKLLSLNNKISCSSCHQQQFGFTDTAQFSQGFLGGFTTRHSMSLINAKYYSNGRFFWDERAATLEDQVLQPIQDKVEMGMTLDSLVLRLQKTNYYPILFKYAFGNETINPSNISKALAQFVRSIISYRSKYDEGLSQAKNRNDDFANFSSEENFGKNLFINNPLVNCFGCHNTDAFISDNPRNNGLTITNNDEGIFIHSKNPNDIGKFKAPSLRGATLRAKYMHDGSIGNLKLVLEHYNSNIQPNPNLDPHLKEINGKPLKMNLSNSEINALEAFINTLTDYKLMNDEKFASPFK